MMISVDEVERAASLVANASRIVVIGCAGNGKTTLSLKLAKELRVPHVSCDRDIFWLPGWKLRPRHEILERMRFFVAQQRWIIDGNSPGTLPLRLQRADVVIWLRFPRYQSLWGIFSRWIRYRGTVRPEMAEGCPEKIDWKFLNYVWNFEKTESPEILDRLKDAQSDLPIITLRSRSDVNKLVEFLDGSVNERGATKESLVDA